MRNVKDLLKESHRFLTVKFLQDTGARKWNYVENFYLEVIFPERRGLLNKKIFDKQIASYT